MELNSVKVDLKAEKEGTWFPFDDESDIKIAAWGNKKHLKFLREQHTKYGRKLATNRMKDEEADIILADQWQYIVKDWRGITEGGVDVECTPEKLSELAGNKQYKYFFARIEAISKEDENFRVEAVQELGEDSPAM